MKKLIGVMLASILLSCTDGIVQKNENVIILDKYNTEEVNIDGTIDTGYYLIMHTGNGSTEYETDEYTFNSYDKGDRITTLIISK
jgi:hypothetical protein